MKNTNIINYSYHTSMTSTAFNIKKDRRC